MKLRVPERWSINLPGVQIRMSTLLEPPCKLQNIKSHQNGMKKMTSRRSVLPSLVSYKLRLFMCKGVLSGCYTNLRGNPISISEDQFVTQYQLTFNPRPFAIASNVSWTCSTKSLVGRTISARRRVDIRDDSIFNIGNVR